jgi:hypothetical protein
MKNMRFNDLVLLLGVIEIWWFSISLFMDFDSPCCIVTSSSTM